MSDNRELIQFINHYNDIFDSLDDSQKRIISKELYDRISSLITVYGAFRNLVEVKDALQVFLGTEAFDRCLEYGSLDTTNMIITFWQMIRVYVSENRMENLNSDTFYRKMVQILEGYLKNNNVVSEDGKIQIDLKTFDNIFRQYIFAIDYSNRKDLFSDGLANKMLDIFLKNIPESDLLGDYLSFNRPLTSDNFLLSKEIFERKLRELETKIDDKSEFDKFDEILCRYLTLYNKEKLSGMAIEAFDKLVKNVRGGRLTETLTYERFINKYVDNDVAQMLAVGSGNVLFTDLVTRLYEEGPEDIKLTDMEYKIIYGYWLNNGERIYGGNRFEESLSNFRYNDTLNSIPITQYVIRMQQLFSKGKIPKDEKTLKVYNVIKNINVVDLLKQNFDPLLLKNGETRNLVAADRALALLIEYDQAMSGLDEKHVYDNGFKVLTNESFVKLLEANGNSVYDSEAMKRFVELYVDNFDNKSSYKDQIIENFVIMQLSKTGFDFMQNQLLCDIYQLFLLNGVTNGPKSAILTIFENKFKNVDIEQERKIVYEFIDRFNNKPVKDENEQEFRQILESINKIKFKNKNILDQKIVDFILAQTFMKDSVIKTKKDKYQHLVERAIEDLGKNDFLQRTNGKSLEYVYCIRDYLKKSSTLGLHTTGNFLKSIKIKRDMVNDLYRQNIEIIDTIFHENTHMVQQYRINEIPKTDLEYSVFQDMMLSLFVEDYYTKNYWAINEENEARMLGAEMAADYISRIVPDVSITQMADNIRNEVITNLRNTINEKKVDARDEKNKIDEEFMRINPKTEKKEPISDMMEALLQSSPRWLASKYPGFCLEYDSRTGKRLPMEKLLQLASISGNYDLYRYIFYSSDVMYREGNFNRIFDILISSLDNNNSKEYIDFIGNIISDNIIKVLDREINNSKLLENCDLDYILHIYYFRAVISHMNDNQYDNPILYILANGKSRSDEKIVDKFIEYVDVIEKNIPNYQKYVQIFEKYGSDYSVLYRNDGTKKSLEDVLKEAQNSDNLDVYQRIIEDEFINNGEVSFLEFSWIIDGVLDNNKPEFVSFIRGLCNNSFSVLLEHEKEMLGNSKDDNTNNLFLFCYFYEGILDLLISGKADLFETLFLGEDSNGKNILELLNEFFQNCRGTIPNFDDSYRDYCEKNLADCFIDRNFDDFQKSIAVFKNPNMIAILRSLYDSEGKMVNIHTLLQGIDEDNAKFIKLAISKSKMLDNETDFVKVFYDVSLMLQENNSPEYWNAMETAIGGNLFTVTYNKLLEFVGKCRDGKEIKIQDIRELSKIYYFIQDVLNDDAIKGAMWYLYDMSYNNKSLMESFEDWMDIFKGLVESLNKSLPEIGILMKMQKKEYDFDKGRMLSQFSATVTVSDEYGMKG